MLSYGLLTLKEMIAQDAFRRFTTDIDTGRTSFSFKGSKLWRIVLGILTKLCVSRVQTELLHETC